MAPRDAYHYVFVKPEPNENNSIYVALYTVDDEDDPEESGCVRMTIPIGGIAFKSVEGGTKTDATLMLESNLNIKAIPDFVIKEAINL